MWEIYRDFTFEASHVLPNHDGKCSRLHGHSWKGTLICHGNKINESGPKQGMLVDFDEIDKVMRPLIDECLDHHHLNDSLKLESPTCEKVAQWVYQQIILRTQFESLRIYPPQVLIKRRNSINVSGDTGQGGTKT